MSTVKYLLPPNTSVLEKRAAEICQQAVQNQIPIALLINPEKCPLAYLTYLAWAFSVDNWEENWSEGYKRQVIKQSIQVHKKKGTIGAVRRVVESLGYEFELIEWFNDRKEAAAGTFRTYIEIKNGGISADVFSELVRLVEDAKPVSRHLKQMAITMTIKQKINALAFNHLGEITSIYPQ
ncbi:phage tail protein I [Actinobacillus minor]|uniref:phage tail protein I n=1 Tax=Actinobacillus minor TaxID=51047 RepID=UPI0026EA3FDC|nr:phage tail protein I [Actinobacillus minor]